MIKSATLQIHRQGQWVDIATITPDKPEAGHLDHCRLEYDQTYVLENIAAEDSPAARASCLYPVNFDLYDKETWPAFLLDIMPSGAGRDQWLKRLSITDGISADWPLLLNGAGSPPGNLRVKESLAGRSDTLPVPTASGDLVQLKDHPGFTRGQIIDRQEYFIEYAYQNGAQTAGASDVQGEAPKFLLVKDHQGMWHAEGAIADDKVGSHWLVKFPRGKTDRDRLLLKNEKAYMDVARELGLNVFASLFWESDTLFIPRFDRVVHDDRTVTRIGMESLYALTGVAKYGDEYGGKLTHNALCKAIHAFTTAPEANLMEYVLRDVVNVVMGNKDNHPRNTAVFRHETGVVELTPLFDFAPMYLDPAGIARSCRWEGAQETGGEPVWGRVLEALPGNLSMRDCHIMLSRFGEKLERLTDIMKACGVDDSITESRLPGIQKHSQQLIDLAANPSISLSSKGSTL